MIPRHKESHEKGNIITVDDVTAFLLNTKPPGRITLAGDLKILPLHCTMVVIILHSYNFMISASSNHFPHRQGLKRWAHPHACTIQFYKPASYVSRLLLRTCTSISTHIIIPHPSPKKNHGSIWSFSSKAPPRTRLALLSNLSGKHSVRHSTTPGLYGWEKIPSVCGLPACGRYKVASGFYL